MFDDVGVSVFVSFNAGAEEALKTILTCNLIFMICGCILM